jgi:hypothetical protein
LGCPVFGVHLTPPQNLTGTLGLLFGEIRIARNRVLTENTGLTLSIEEQRQLDEGKFVEMTIDGRQVYVISVVTGRKLMNLLDPVLQLTAEVWTSEGTEEDSALYEG